MGLDIAERAVDAARATLRSAHITNADVVCADVLALDPFAPLADDGAWEFDLVFDCQTYHCVRQIDREASASAYASLVAPGGTLVVLTGNSDEEAERGPCRLSRSEVATAFENTALRLESIEVSRFDTSETYRRQPFPEPPLAWLARWRRDR